MNPTEYNHALEQLRKFHVIYETPETLSDEEVSTMIYELEDATLNEIFHPAIDGQAEYFKTIFNNISEPNKILLAMRFPKLVQYAN